MAKGQQRKTKEAKKPKKEKVLAAAAAGKPISASGKKDK